MAKETDYAVILAAASTTLDEKEYTIVDLIGRDLAVLCLINIYTTNDVCSGFGQDFRGVCSGDTPSSANFVSVISSQRRISVIIDGAHSFFKDDSWICNYDSIEDDMNEIAMILQCAIDRAMT